MVAGARCKDGSGRRSGGNGERGLQRRDQARRPGLDAGLDAVRAAEGARGRAEHPDRALRRHRAGRLVAVRRAHQHADDGPAGRERPDLHAVAHDRAVLADAVDLPDRSQPPRQPACASIMEGTNGFPGAAGRHPRRVRDHRPGAAGQRLHAPSGSARTTTSPRRTSPRAAAARSGRCRWASTASTASSAARPTTGIPTWSRTTASSSSRTPRRRATTCRRTSPTRRSQMLRDQQATNPSKPWYHVVLPGRQPRAAPRAAGVHRQVQGHVRRRLRGLPRVGAGPDDRARASCPRAPS